MAIGMEKAYADIYEVLRKLNTYDLALLYEVMCHGAARLHRIVGAVIEERAEVSPEAAQCLER